MGYKPMKRTARISDAEREVLNLLWDRSPQTVSELIASLAPTRSWKTQTVYVLLRRLIEKASSRSTAMSSRTRSRRQ